MAKSSAKSGGSKKGLELFLSHPFPGIRIERGSSKPVSVTLGRPGLISKTLTNTKAREAKPDLGSPESMSKPKRMGRARALMTRSNDRDWQCGAHALNAGDHETAHKMFTKVLDRDPGYADAILGLHALDPHAPGPLERMMSSIERFGEARERLGVRINSFYSPLGYGVETLEIKDDLYRAYARELSSAGEHERASELLDGITDCPLTTLVRIRIAADSGEWHECLEGCQRMSELGGVFGLDLMLFRALSLHSLGLYEQALKALEMPIEHGPKEMRRFATYDRGLILELCEREEEAREVFATLYAEDVHYRDVAQRVLGIEAAGLSWESDQGVEADGFDEIIAGLEAGDLADDPSLPDNWSDSEDEDSQG